MGRIVLTFKSDEYITGKIKTKVDIATTNFNHYAAARQNAKDAEEQAEITRLMYAEERKLDELWKEALEAYVDDIGTDEQRIYADADDMMHQINYEYIISAYGVHIALNSLETSRKRIEEWRNDPKLKDNFLFTATIDDITVENITPIIEEVQRACFHRVLDEQLYAIEKNYKDNKAEGGKIGDNLALACRAYIAELIEAAGGAEVFIRDMHAKVSDTATHIKETDYKEPIDAEAIQLEIFNSDLISVPTSATLHLLQGIQSNRGNVPEYVTKKNRANKKNAISVSKVDADPIEYKQGANVYTQIDVKGKESITITLPEMQRQVKSNRPASNMLTFLLPQIERQAFNNGKLYAEYISFNLQELVDIGMYADIRSARRGNEAAAEALKGIEIGARTEGGAFIMATIFPTIEKTENNVCTYHINPQINWTALLKYHYQLPKYYYSLPTKAQDLLNNLVAYLARQNAAQIQDKGYFTISLRQVQAELSLPDEHKTKDVNGKIKKPIVEAINAVNKADGGKYYKLELHVDKNAKPSQYLDTGVIRVYPLNEVKDHILNVKDQRDRIIAANVKKIEKRKEKALTKAINTGDEGKDSLGGN